MLGQRKPTVANVADGVRHEQVRRAVRTCSSRTDLLHRQGTNKSPIVRRLRTASEPWPSELPLDSLNVPTYRPKGPEAATRQLTRGVDGRWNVSTRGFGSIVTRQPCSLVRQAFQRLVGPTHVHEIVASANEQARQGPLGSPGLCDV